jgi:signal peptidase I
MSKAKHIKTVIHWKLKLLVLIILPIVVFMLVTSKSDVLFGVRSFVVLSGSMEPTLPVGSVVFTKAATSYQKGDVVTFQKNGAVVTHRLNDFKYEDPSTSSGQVRPDQPEQEFIQTKGDANKNADAELITKSDILGKQILMVPLVGKFIVYLKTLPGLILFIMVPSVLFILFELWNMKHHMEREAEKKIRAQMEKESN